MKKNLFAFILFAVIASGCNNATDTQDTATETIVNEPETAPADSVNTTEIDNTTVEIEAASEEVDSLLNDI
jgi:PBP1b-binding outer membrane lipoprotein LpoB